MYGQLIIQFDFLYAKCEKALKIIF